MSQLRKLARKVYRATTGLPWNQGMSNLEDNAKLVMGGSWPKGLQVPKVGKWYTWTLSPETHIGGIGFRVLVVWSGKHKAVGTVYGNHCVYVYADNVIKYPGGFYFGQNWGWHFSPDAWSWAIAKAARADEGRGDTVQVGRRGKLLALPVEAPQEPKRYCAHCKELLTEIDELPRHSD